MLPLPANQPETFYRGAGRIAEFRTLPALPGRPEDWVGSVTSRFELAPAGLSTLPDGRCWPTRSPPTRAGGSARTAPTPGCW